MLLHAPQVLFVTLENGLVAVSAAGIHKALPFFGNELPVVGVGLEREFENAERGSITQFTVGLGFAEGAMILAAGANNKFADATLGVSRAIRSLRSEALVVVIVAAENYVGVGFIEGLPEGLHRQVIAVGAAGTEERLVPVGERASDVMRGEVGAKPLFLRRTCLTAADILAFAIEHDDVPGAEFVAVIAGLGVSGSGAKIIKVRCGAGSVKLVIAGGRPGAGFYAAPSLVVTGKILLAAVGVGEVAVNCIATFPLEPLPKSNHVGVESQASLSTDTVQFDASNGSKPRGCSGGDLDGVVLSNVRPLRISAPG